MYTKNTALAIVAGLIVLSAIQDCRAEDLNLTYVDKFVEQSIAATLLTDIYKRAGLTAKMQPMIGARATLAVLANKSDGEVARVEGYAQKNPTLIKVDPSYYYVTTTAFAKIDKNITISSKADLKKYKVGAVRNVAHVEAAIKEVSGVQFVDNSTQLYQILESGAVDVVLDSGVNGRVYAKKLGFSDIKQVGELAKVNLFNILNPSRKEYVSKIGETIKALIDSGELAKLTKHVEDEAIKKGLAD